MKTASHGIFSIGHEYKQFFVEVSRYQSTNKRSQYELCGFDTLDMNILQAVNYFEPTITQFTKRR